MARTDQIELNAWLNSSGAADDSWLAPDKPLGRIFTLEHYEQAARIAHRGVFSNIFLSDRPQLIISEQERPEHILDPVALISALLSRVPDIGGVITSSTTYNDPYTLARQVQSANLLSGGRVGWNIVTSWNPAIADNYTATGLPSRAERYARAFEFVEVVTRLWESWHFPWTEADRRPDEPYYGTPAAIDHAGTYFNVKGPLNVPLGPTGRPFIVQAGGSDEGINLAARYADLVYAARSSREGTKAFRAHLHETARGYGRTALPRVVAAISPIIVSSEAEAAEQRRQFAEELVPSAADEARIARTIGVDPAKTDRTRRLTADDFQPIGESIVPLGVVRAKIRLALDKGFSLAELARHEIQPSLIGTPRQVADFVLDWWLDEAVDGFTVSPNRLPEDLELFVDQVVPLLQATPYYASSYEERRARRAGLPEVQRV